jgi:predicted RNase H-like nuclease (RuvC/YqgF family)
MTPADFPVTIPQVGGLTGAVLAAALMFSYVWSRFRKDNAENNAGAGLYNNLSDQVDKLVLRIKSLEEDRDKWQKEAIDLRMEVSRLKTLEESNERLSKKLEDKDVQTTALVNELIVKNNAITEMQDRIHQLEMKAQEELYRCRTCEYKS